MIGGAGRRHQGGGDVAVRTKRPARGRREQGASRNRREEPVGGSSYAGIGHRRWQYLWSDPQCGGVWEEEGRRRLGSRHVSREEERHRAVVVTPREEEGFHNFTKGPRKIRASAQKFSDRPIGPEHVAPDLCSLRRCQGGGGHRRFKPRGSEGGGGPARIRVRGRRRTQYEVSSHIGRIFTTSTTPSGQMVRRFKKGCGGAWEEEWRRRLLAVRP